MKNTLISLVLIWFAAITMDSFARVPNIPDNQVEHIYIKYITTSTDSDSEKETVENKEETVTPQNTESAKEDLPRLKRIYIAAYGGYFYTKENNFEFNPTNGCNPSYNFICNNDKSVNPIKAEANDDYFLTAAFGINSENPLRLELSYYKMGKELELEGQNIVDLDTIDYTSNIDLQGGSVNLYFDFILNRRNPSFIFTPYAMAGIGISEIELGDINFTGRANNDLTIKGKTQRNKTVIFGAGLTAGINNYISLDIGYRYYDFGKIKTSHNMISSVTDNTDEENPVITEDLYDLELQSDFDAHVAVIGLKIQI